MCEIRVNGTSPVSHYSLYIILHLHMIDQSMDMGGPSNTVLAPIEDPEIFAYTAYTLKFWKMRKIINDQIFNVRLPQNFAIIGIDSNVSNVFDYVYFREHTGMHECNNEQYVFYRRKINIHTHTHNKTLAFLSDSVSTYTTYNILI